MSIKASLIKNTGFNLAGYIYLLVTSFFSISILLGNLGRDLFGVYLFLGSFIPLAAVFDFGISNAIVRRLSLPDITKSEKVTAWKTSFSLFLVISISLSLVVGGILLFVTRTLPMFKIIDPIILNWTVLILVITVFVNHLNSHFLSLPQAEQRFDVFNSKTLLVGTGNTLLSAILSAFFPNLALIFLLQLVFHIFTSIYMTIYSYRIFPGKSFLPGYNEEEGRGLVDFGLKNFAGTLANQADVQISKYALGSLSSASAITAFSIPQNIVLKAAGVISQIAQVVFPLSSSLLEKSRIEKLKKMVLGIEALTFLCGILAITLSFTVGREFLLWWLKDEIVVSAAFPILKILSIHFLITALTPIPSVLVQSIGKPQITSFFAILTAVVDGIAMFILIPQFGVLGAAYATLLSSILTVPPFLIVAWVLFNKEIKRTLSLA
ncbi:MAG TPA: polysaccharide biosynthesis C-terminal domain-containing protein [Spirochaetia bacterium]|nr:polysaccharide biosynthesis C-terminal domain-containing protein [Spirochaetia bacterium]